MVRSDVFEDLEWRGLVHQITDPEVPKLLSSERVTAYCGFDPTAPSLTTAHLLQILTLRRLQSAGHRPIALAGGGTGLIGDPSLRDTERALLSADQIEGNLLEIRNQLENLLDFSAGPASAVVLNNADWLTSLKLTDFLRDIGKHFSINMMISKDSVRARLNDREQGLSFTEFSYMLLQAFDFLYLFDHHGCRLQLGGSDQWGNITVGIELIRRSRGKPAYGMTTPLLLGPDGRKMSKSEGGAVWLDPRLTSPYSFFQFWYNTDDSQVIQFLKFFTFLPWDEIEGLEQQARTEPAERAAQRVLATEVTSLVHGSGEAAKAIKASKALFGAELQDLDEKLLLEVLAEVPSSEEIRTSLENGQATLVDLMVKTGLAGSKSEARSHISGGGAYMNNRRISDVEAKVAPSDLLFGKYLLLRRGKKTHHLVRVS